jgi:5-formyltetrahydrofolate cyclo-ligase
MNKLAIRKRCWGALLASGADRFPGVEGRIPNFVGAEAAAALLADTPTWRKARCLKANPDSPQRPARHRALKEGKRLYLAVPRLAAEKPFLLVDPADLNAKELWKASSIKGAEAMGRPVGLDEMEPVELILTGCVGVGRDGARLGKGGGYSDLEYALLREAGLVGPRTPIVTTVHDVQVLKAGAVPMTAHDISLDLFATPTELVRCPRAHKRPRGVLWSELDEERRAAIPALRDGGPAEREAKGRRRAGSPRGR